jgi:hypothetical protein
VSCSPSKEPSVSEPSEPESSEPASSEPESSEPESSEPESSEPSESEDDEDEYYIPASGQTLPIGTGNKTCDGPDNLKNPIDISDYTNFDFFNSIPEHWSYITGNRKSSGKGDFFAESFGGGFKFAQLYYGLQTPVINSWKKIEIRFYISAVTNNSAKKDLDAPIFHIYGYDKSGKYITLDYLDQGSITTQTKGNFVRVYVRNENIAYLEFRLNAFPYKSSQCYNFGVDKITLKGFPYDS